MFKSKGNQRRSSVEEGVTGRRGQTKQIPLPDTMHGHPSIKRNHMARRF